MQYLERLDKLHPDIIQHFLTTGDSAGIPDELQKFIMQLQFAAEVYEYEKNITRAAAKLQEQIQVRQKITMPLRTCKARIYAALNYFNIDNNVSIKVWENDFADKYHDLAQLALQADDIKTAKACYDAARKSRLAASEAAARETDWAPVFIISPEITAEQMGFQRQSLKEIARKNNEGFYLSLIDSLPIEKHERARLLRDAEIEDVDFEEIETNPNDE